MKPLKPLLWPLLVGLLSLAVTTWLWQHERQTQERSLRSTFEAGLRQTATRIEERLTSYEQMLRGARGLFDASRQVSRDDFSSYVDSLTAGAGFSGLRTIAYAALRRPGDATDPADDRGLSAPVTYSAPGLDPALQAIGHDLRADPAVRAALLRARDSGGAVVTDRLPQPPAAAKDDEVGVLLCLPIYAEGQALDRVAARRALLTGWVLASFRISDLMSSLYGEVTPGLDVRLHDGVAIDDSTRLYPPAPTVGATPLPRFEAQEYLGVAGRTWTLLVRSRPEFEQRYSNDSAQIIAIAGTGLSLALALLTWQLVTGRERAQASARAMTSQLRASAEQYRRIVETANEGIWMVDAEGHTVFVNPKLRQMLGYTDAELSGRRWVDFMDQAARAALESAGREQLRRGPAEHLDIRFRRKDGTDLHTTLATSPIRDDAGRHAGALAMVTDVTDRKLAEGHRVQLEAQLRQSQKMQAIGTLAGGIAHDFNNILAAILGNVALVEQDLGAGHPEAGRLAQIRQAAERGRSLVQQIGAFSRRQPQQRLNQPLRPLLEETAKLLRSTLPALVELELRLSDAALHVSADATQLQQVLMNLCTNAWHAMAGGTGRIVVGLDVALLDPPAAERLGGVAPGPHAHLWVADDGCGMDEATVTRIFEPFYTTKPVGKGTGLGLSVVHGIVTAHGGAIAVDSAPGRGTTFNMYFPLAEPACSAQSPAAAAPAAPRGRGQHVLYVDDDPVMVVMVEGLLRRLGYRATAVDDPRRALVIASARDDGVDVVVTDFNMPEFSGLDLARELIRIRPDLPVLITSGYVSDHLRSEALRSGVRHVLQKEYTLEQLGGLVHGALNEPDGAEPAVPS